MTTGSESQTAATETLETKIEGVADEIAETPAEDRDEEWRSQINSTLAAISADLTALKKAAPSGKSPELIQLEATVSRLEAKLDKLQAPAPTPTPEPLKDAAGNPIPATPPATLSGPPTPEPEPATKRKKAREKNWL